VERLDAAVGRGIGGVLCGISRFVGLGVDAMEWASEWSAEGVGGGLVASEREGGPLAGVLDADAAKGTAFFELLLLRRLSRLRLRVLLTPSTPLLDDFFV